MKKAVFEALHHGMTDEQKKRLNDFNLTQEWRVQCWNCRKFNDIFLNSIPNSCKHCGKSLSHKD